MVQEESCAMPFLYAGESLLFDKNSSKVRLPF